jgi:hypothetical protein
MSPEQYPAGARGPSSGREFESGLAGGAIRRLSTRRVRVTERGVDVVERHVARFGPDAPNQAMIRRLRAVASGRRTATRFDLNFYTHELREFTRYRRLGWNTGQPPDPEAAYELWNHTHTAALEDYGLPAAGALYDPEIAPDL